MPVLSIAMPFVSQRELELALAVLTAIDLRQMRWQPLPPLFKSGVRYAREPRGKEVWLSAVELLKARKGDCEDLCCYRAAELRRGGERARAIAVRTGRGWHIVVQRANGRLEDPSVTLGMPVGRNYRASMRAALEARR